MKRITLLILAMGFIMLTLTSCSADSFLISDEIRAEATLEKIVNAVNNNDAEALVSLFSNNVLAEKPDLLNSANEFIEFIDGEIFAYTDSAENGVFSSTEFEYGKRRKEIQPSFSVETTAGKYHIAILECLIDDYDEANVGVTSIYIINAENRHNDYVYRGDGNWTPGINIEKGEIENEEISNSNFISSILADPHNLMLRTEYH